MRTLDSGQLCSSPFSRFFTSPIWSLKPLLVTILRKPCPARTFSFALGVWSSVFIGRRPFSSKNVNFSSLLFVFRLAICYAPCKPMSAMSGCSPPHPPRPPFCTPRELFLAPSRTPSSLPNYAVLSVLLACSPLNTLATVFVVEGLHTLFVVARRLNLSVYKGTGLPMLSTYTSRNLWSGASPLLI